MTVDELHDQRTSTVLLASSGAKMGPIGVDVARSFLARVDEAGNDFEIDDVAWGALEDSGTLAAVAVLGITSSTRGRASIAVVPARRRLGLGTDLLQLLVAEARARDFKTLSFVHPLVNPAPQELVRSLHLTVARRIRDKTALMVVILPGSMPDDDRGER
jgi:GNAT superfamily N-acetyltransferase